MHHTLRIMALSEVVVIVGLVQLLGDVQSFSRRCRRLCARRGAGDVERRGGGQKLVLVPFIQNLWTFRRGGQMEGNGGRGGVWLQELLSAQRVR